MAELFDVRTSNLVQGCILTISRMSLMGKVKGPGHQVEKYDFRSILKPFSALCDTVHYSGHQYGVMTSQYHVTWCHGCRQMSCTFYEERPPVSICLSIRAKGLVGKRTVDYRMREVCQRWGVFISCIDSVIWQVNCISWLLKLPACLNLSQ